MNQYIFEPVKPVVETKFGKLRGVTYGDVNIFMGVKYAKAKRFHMPKEQESWEGIRNAYTYGPVAPITEDSICHKSMVKIVRISIYGLPRP